MGKFAGATLKLLQTFLYALCFCCAAIILGFYSYFLSVRADRDQPIPRAQLAVEGMSGIAVVYGIFAVILTCCIGGITFFAFLGIVLDVLFTGAFIAIAVLTRDGAHSCSGFVNTPIGSGLSNTRGQFGGAGFGTGEGENLTYAVSYGRACTYNKVCFAVAIAGAVLFLLSAVVQVFLGRHHKKEKRFGPSPTNGYTAGTTKRKFWQRRTGPKTTEQARDAELANGGLAPTHPEIRPSHETAYTGTTAGTNAAYATDKTAAPAAGYHTGPAVNY